MLGAAQVGLVRMSALATRRRLPRGRRVLVTGLASYWGGRLAQALERFPRSRRSSASTTSEPTRELERTEFVKVGEPALADRSGSSRAAEIDTVIDTRLVVDSLTTSPRLRPREQRDRDAQHPRGLHGRGLAGPAVRLQELRPLLRVRAGRSRRSSPRRCARPHPPRTPIERDIVEAEAAVARLRASRDPGCHGDRAALRQRARPGRRHGRSPGCSRLPAVPMISASIPATSSSTRTTSSTRSSTPRFTELPGLQRRRRRGAGAVGGDRPARQARRCRSCPRGEPACYRFASPARVPDPGRDAQPDAVRAGGRQPALKATGSTTLHDSRGRPAAWRAPALSPVMRGVKEPYSYEREVEEFLRWSPHVRRDQPGERGGVAADREPLGI